MEVVYPQTVSAIFKRPAILPDDFTCHWQQVKPSPGAAGTEFYICSKTSGKTVISGDFTCGKAAAAKI